MSNYTWVCVSCRFVSKSITVCPHCHDGMLCAGKKWSAPKKNNDRAWKRIENGEWLWDRRRVRRRARSKNRLYDKISKVKGEGRYTKFNGWVRYHQKPDIDMGG